jgi:hypothetical protein
VSFRDDLCREFIAIEGPGELGDRSLDAWVDSTFISQLTQINGVVLERKAVQTKYGPADFLRYRHPGGGVCLKLTISDGKQVNEKPDAEVGVYNLYFGGHFYRFMYVLTDNPALDGFWVKRRPLDQQLAQFVDGSEILRAVPR